MPLSPTISETWKHGNCAPIISFRDVISVLSLCSHPTFTRLSRSYKDNYCETTHYVLTNNSCWLGHLLHIYVFIYVCCVRTRWRQAIMTHWSDTCPTSWLLSWRRPSWRCLSVALVAHCTAPCNAFHIQLEGCIVWNDTIQYSPKAVRYPCTSFLLPACDDA